jgi:hypothetical protein
MDDLLGMNEFNGLKDLFHNDTDLLTSKDLFFSFPFMNQIRQSTSFKELHGKIYLSLCFHDLSRLKKSLRYKTQRWLGVSATREFALQLLIFLLTTPRLKFYQEP